MIGRQSYEIRAVTKDTLTLDRGLPLRDRRSEDEDVTKHKYHVFKPLFARDGNRFTLDRLTVFCAKPKDFRFRFFPWCHWNHGQEATQGLRFEMKSQSGEFITVLYPGRDAPEMNAVEGGVQVGDDVITFAGGIDDDEGTAYVSAKVTDAALGARLGQTAPRQTAIVLFSAPFRLHLAPWAINPAVLVMAALGVGRRLRTTTADYEWPVLFFSLAVVVAVVVRRSTVCVR